MAPTSERCGIGSAPENVNRTVCTETGFNGISVNPKPASAPTNRTAASATSCSIESPRATLRAQSMLTLRIWSSRITFPHRAWCRFRHCHQPSPKVQCSLLVERRAVQ